MEHLVTHLEGSDLLEDVKPNTSALNTAYPGSDRPYKCTQCGDTQTTMQHLHDHLQVRQNSVGM